jgi:hypothetical protein
MVVDPSKYSAGSVMKKRAFVPLTEVSSCASEADQQSFLAVAFVEHSMIGNMVSNLRMHDLD